MNNLKGELSVMDNLGIKPNYAALGRKYGMDYFLQALFGLSRKKGRTKKVPDSYLVIFLMRP